MIGNDVVDILQARRESNWQRKGFLEKLFTIEEQEMILSATNPEIMVWTLWSMKEAAYKAYNRITGKRGFIAQKLKCSLHPKSIVTCNGYTFYCETSIKDFVINTIAALDEFDLRNIISIGNSAVYKDGHKLPYMLHENKRYPASVSHHGRANKAIALYP